MDPYDLYITFHAEVTLHEGHTINHYSYEEFDNFLQLKQKNNKDNNNEDNKDEDAHLFQYQKVEIYVKNIKCINLINKFVNLIKCRVLTIHFEKFVDLNLSQIQRLFALHIDDVYGFMPKEYLYHLIDLLEGKVDHLRVDCLDKQSIKEDLEEFDNITVKINLLGKYTKRDRYYIKRKIKS